jgi:Na+-translocating ferredoxin:NAD+ oxidoreductase RnfD subunit
MTKNWTIIEKIIALILVTGSGLLFYLTYIGFHNYLDSVLGKIPLNQIRWLYFFNIYQNAFFISLGTLLAGILLMINKKVGWIIAIAILFLLAFSFYFPSLTAPKYIFDDASSKVVAAVIGFSLFCLTLLTTLLLKPFREKYKPTRANWIVILIIIVLGVIDRIFV